MAKKKADKRPARARYKSELHREKNKKRRVAKAEQKKAFYALRNQVMQEQGLSKSDARRYIKKNDLISK